MASGKTVFPTGLSPFTSGGRGSLIAAMLKPGAWLVMPLLFLPLAAQDAPQVLPDPVPPPDVDTITPVPPPEIPFGSPEAMQPEMPKNLKIENFGGGPISGNVEEGVRFAGPGVKLSGDNGLEIFADRLLWDIKAQTVTLEGNVSVYQGNLMQRGERTVYYYERKFLDASGLRASIDPILLEAGKFTVEQEDGNQVYVGHDAGITTHDVENPNYWIRAKKTRVYPGDKIVFNDLRLYAGDTPVFWLPYLSQPLDADLGYHLVPGSRSNWGPFLLNTYGIMLGGNDDPAAGALAEPWLLSRWHFDLRSRRGAAVGVDLSDIRLKENDNLTGLGFYYTYDLDPTFSRSGVPRPKINPSRFGFDLHHLVPFPTLDSGAQYDARFNLTVLSDRYFLEDFDPERYRTDPEPDSTIGIFRRTEDSVAGLFTRLQLNEFQQTAGRLPELFFDQIRRPVFGTPVLHQGRTSIGAYREDLADYRIDSLLAQLQALPPGDPRAPALVNALRENGFQRFDTYQELALPLKPGGWLSLTPGVGLGYTRYWGVEGNGRSDDRTLAYAGIDASVKFSKQYEGLTSRTWGIDGLMHVVQPYLGYSFVSTDQLDPSIPSIDRLTFTTRPRPISVGSFSAIDDLQDWSIVRAGVTNRLITRRDHENFEWLFLDTYIDAFLQDPELNREFSNLHNDIRWRPLPWLAVNLDTQFPVVNDGSSFSEFISNFHFMPNDRFDFSIGYRMLDNHPVLVDSNRIDVRAFARLNENWGVGFLHLWELDDGTLEVQQYTIHRDLGNWTAGLGLTHRDNRLQDEYGVIFSLSLKDFPSVSLPFKIDAE